MPLDRISRGFKDISLTLKKNPLTRDLLVLKNEYAIARSVQNLVLTIQGEKPFDPDFGCAVNRLLFENISFFTAKSLKDEIEVEGHQNLSEFTINGEEKNVGDNK